ncbi:MAG: response regulator [Elusimicrobia bacterium]|nr:response regulator [Elusimicrobiota bacterium]
MTEEPRVKVTAIDDDDAVLEMYETGLGAAGFELRTFSDPKLARTFFAGARSAEMPDVILMDIKMPDLDGITLMNEIRAMDAAAHIPILAVSILADAVTVSDARLFGAMDYIEKPFNLLALTDKINLAAEISRKRAPKP